jgi:hypothetical protein
MYPASRESAAFGDQAMMRIRAYRFHLLGAVSEEASFPTRIYSTPIDRCAISKLRRKPEARSFVRLTPPTSGKSLQGESIFSRRHERFC